MEKTKEEMKKHWWYRLYVVVLWTGSISAGLYNFINQKPYEKFVSQAILISFFSFLGIFLLFRFLLWVAFGGKVFFKNDKKVFLTWLSVLALFILITFIFYKFNIVI